MYAFMSSTRRCLRKASTSAHPCMGTSAVSDCEERPREDAEPAPPAHATARVPAATMLTMEGVCFMSAGGCRTRADEELRRFDVVSRVPRRTWVTCLCQTLAQHGGTEWDVFGHGQAHGQVHGKSEDAWAGARYFLLAGGVVGSTSP